MLSGCQCFLRVCCSAVPVCSNRVETFPIFKIREKGSMYVYYTIGIGGGTRLSIIPRHWECYADSDRKKQQLYTWNKTKQYNRKKKSLSGCYALMGVMVIFHLLFDIAELTNCLPSVGRNTSSISTMDGSSLKRASSFFFLIPLKYAAAVFLGLSSRAFTADRTRGKIKPPTQFTREGQVGQCVMYKYEQYYI